MLLQFVCLYCLGRYVCAAVEKWAENFHVNTPVLALVPVQAVLLRTVVVCTGLTNSRDQNCMEISRSVTRLYKLNHILRFVSHDKYSEVQVRSVQRYCKFQLSKYPNLATMGSAAESLG